MWVLGLVNGCFLMCAAPGVAQDAAAWQQRLAGRPLYLRGQWQESDLEFDDAGKPLKEAQPGPLTLSGIDVTSVVLRGATMVVRGERVALVGTANGRLERRTPESTTIVLGVLIKKNRNFKAREELKLTLHADPSGSFERPVHAVFADGLQDFAQHVPPYWLCYAEGYMAQDVSDDQSKQTTDSCLKRVDMDDSAKPAEDFASPQLLSRENLKVIPPEVSELGLHGRSVTRVLIDEHGMPLALQVVQPLGAGLDEELMQSEARSRYRPASLHGKAAEAATDVVTYVDSTGS